MQTIDLQNERNDVDILRRRMDASALLIKALAEVRGRAGHDMDPKLTEGAEVYLNGRPETRVDAAMAAIQSLAGWIRVNGIAADFSAPAGAEAVIVPFEKAIDGTAAWLLDSRKRSRCSVSTDGMVNKEPPMKISIIPARPTALWPAVGRSFCIDNF